MSAPEDRHEFEQLLLRLIRQYPGGVGEYDLIKELVESGCDGLRDTFGTDSLALFQTHFAVYNSLYRLRDQLFASRRGYLDIGPARVQLLPYSESDAGIERADPLREYYLDLSNLRDTSADDVEAMLDGFWLRFGGFCRREEALAVFGLEEPAEYTEIRSRYRILAMEHHPDRGGSKTRFQEINEAMRVLETAEGAPRISE